MQKATQICYTILYNLSKKRAKDKMKEKKHVSFDVVKGTLPKKKKVHYEWEKPQNHVLEPWHFSAVSLTLDAKVLRVLNVRSTNLICLTLLSRKY